MAALGAGANEEAAQSLTASIIAAEAEGLSCVGLSHFIDYLEAIEAGRIDGNADPIITRPALAVYLCDARGGLAHTGFDRTIDDLAKAAKLFGVAPATILTLLSVILPDPTFVRVRVCGALA